jgi:acetyl-CoA carboxylase carboxyltransferase component
MKTGAPIIGLLDCAGLRLQEATDALNAFGEIYTKQVMASGVIPQITGIFGTCGGGLAVVPALTDFTFMEANKGRLFVNAPNALEGNEISKCDTSSAAYQSEHAGLVDVMGSEEDILAQMRELVSMLPSNFEDNSSYIECTDDLNRVCPELENCAGDTSIALSQIADNQEFFEVKAEYAKDMVTGFIRLNGATVGCVANRSELYNEEGEKTETFEKVLSARGCKKAAEFVKFCDAFDIPVLTLTNVKGYKATKCSEANMARSAAELTNAYISATVPKVNVVVGEAFGSAYLTMNSKSTGADMVFAWTNAQIGMMDAKLAAKIMYADADAATINEKAAEYAMLQSSALSAAKRGYVDTIIQAEDTRKYVIGAFEMLFTKRENRPSKKHGTV